MILPKDADPTLQQIAGELQREYQKIQINVFDHEPQVPEIPNKGFVLAKISGTLYVYTRVETARYRIAFTAV